MDWPFLITTNVVCTDVHCSITTITPLVPLGWLGVSDLDVLVEELSPVNSKWKEIAVYLGIKDVEASHPSDGLREVLQRWLDGGYGTHWYRVVETLRRVGEKHLASELKVKYGELSTTDSSLICLGAEFSLNTVDISGPILLLACDSMGSCCSLLGGVL